MRPPINIRQAYCQPKKSPAEAGHECFLLLSLLPALLSGVGGHILLLRLRLAAGAALPGSRPA
jgi:hypothetical protein